MALDWLPVLPDPTRRPGLPAAISPAHFAQSLPQSEIIGRLWSQSQPTYPSHHLRQPWRPAGGFVVPFVVPAAQPVVPLSWAPQYPVQIHRLALPVAARPTVFSVPKTAVTDLSWLPGYPDQIAQARLPVAARPTVVLTLVPAPPLLSWQGSYPSQIAPRPGLLAAAQCAYTFYVKPVPAPDPPGLGWKTTVYPDRIDPRRSLSATAQRAFVTIVSPIPNPPPPTPVTWWPILPTLPVRPVVRVQAAGIVGPAALFEASGIFHSLRWLATYPSQLAPPLRDAALLTSTAWVEFAAPVLIIPSVQGWSAIYPSRFPVPAQIVSGITAPLLPIPAAPGVIPSTATCLRLTAERSGQPTLENMIGDVGRLTAEIGEATDAEAEEEC